jgi:hypothetical protein
LLAVVLIPLLGVLIYVIARGDKMGEHEVGSEVQLKDLRDRGVLTEEEFQRASERHRQAARNGESRANDIAALEDLKDHGVLTDEEYQRAREKVAA